MSSSGYEPVEQISASVQRLTLSVHTLPPYDHTNAYLVADSGVAVLVDPGSSDPASLETIGHGLARAGAAGLKAVVLTHTHPDHCDGVPLVLEAYGGPPVYVHPLEAQRLPAAWPTVMLQGGRSLTVGNALIEALHTPGHSPGHLSLPVTGSGGLEGVLVGDLVVASGSVWVGLPEGDMAAYLASLERLGDLRAPLLAPGHGEVITAVGPRLRAMIDHRLEREAQIREALADGPLTVADITARVYPGLAPAVADLAQRSVAAHLLKLGADGVTRQLQPGEHGPYALIDD